MRSLGLLVLAGTVALLGACAHAPGSAAPAAGKAVAMAVTVTERDNGGAVRAKVGDTLEVHLAENGGGGYRWEPDGVDARLLELVSSATKYPAGAVGSSGEAQFTVKVLAAGKGNLRFKCWRSWEGEAGVVQRFAVTVEAQ